MLEPEDWGFNWPEELVWLTYQLWVDTHYVVMPFEGGVLDQPADWWDDMLLCLHLDAFQKQTFPAGLGGDSTATNKMPVITSETDV